MAGRSPMMHVVAAAVYDQSHRILIARRPDHVHQGGLWELPGGKREAGESRRQALIRELSEELGINAGQFRPLIQIPHHYPDRPVLLDIWVVTAWQGRPRGRVARAIRWVSPEQLHNFDFPQANRPIIKACQLPAHYLITPPLKRGEDDFLRRLRAALTRGIKLVQLRQPELSAARYKKLAAQVIAVCRRAGAEILLNAEPELVMRLKADGLQLNAGALMSLSDRPLPGSFMIAASCHNAGEIQRAGELGLDFAVLSPVRATATHPHAQPLGWDWFQRFVSHATLPVYALGGMAKEDTAQAWECGAQGIAAVRALW